MPDQPTEPPTLPYASKESHSVRRVTLTIAVVIAMLSAFAGLSIALGLVMAWLIIRATR
jgi:nitrogen fixation protein FixH